jgi:hypothetical protein
MNILPDDMDEAIEMYLEQNRKEGQAYMEAFRTGDHDKCLEPLAHKLWAEGLERWGKAWSEREYTLREWYYK